MKIHVLSDLHNEFAPFEPDFEAVRTCDIVVLAGDIDRGTRGITWARQAFGSKPVIYVCGNHEFYWPPLDRAAGRDARASAALGCALPGERIRRGRRSAFPGLRVV